LFLFFFLSLLVLGSSWWFFLSSCPQFLAQICFPHFLVLTCPMDSSNCREIHYHVARAIMHLNCIAGFLPFFEPTVDWELHDADQYRRTPKPASSPHRPPSPYFCADAIVTGQSDSFVAWGHPVTHDLEPGTKLTSTVHSSTRKQSPIEYCQVKIQSWRIFKPGKLTNSLYHSW